jgi:hypothetical protein
MNKLVRRLFYYGQWHLAFALKDASEPGLARPDRFCSIEPPSNYCYADPFLFRHDGKAYIFFEIYSRSQPGVIAYCEITNDGRYTEPKVVLEARYHLSYPFIFQWRGEIYLLPETHDNGTIELYRAARFPDQWVRHAVLMSGVRFVDPTLHFEEGMWWLFAGCRGRKAEEVSELHLFMSETPLGPWRDHPRNPVVVGEHCARPAGRLFRLDQQLVRPGQDSSRFYGEAIWLNRIDIISQTDYRETPLLRIGPESLPNSSRTHTLDLDGQLQVQDGFRYARRFGNRHAAEAGAAFHAASKKGDEA